MRRERHQPAVALNDLSRWYAELQKRQGFSSPALQFLTLCAARSNEVRGATWTEIDLERGIWTVPAERMKAKRQHQVPLCSEAVRLLRSLPRFQGVDLLFPSAQGKPLSDMTLSKAMRRIHEDDVKSGGSGYPDPRSGDRAVPHGLRSSFRDWAAERTEYPSDLAEFALAHDVGTRVEQAYRRSAMVERRRQMMEDWAEFLCSGSHQRGRLP